MALRRQRTRRREAKSGSKKQLNTAVGANVPIGKLELKASYGLVNASGAGTDANDARQYAAGVVYDLSRNVALYSTYAHLVNRGNARFEVAPLPSDPSPPAANGLPANAGRISRGIDAGFRVSF